MFKNRKLFKAIPLCLAVVFIAAMFAACGAGNKLNKASKAVNNYKIVCEYDDGAKTVAGAYELSYINNTEVPLNELKLHLYGNAYREKAKYPAVSDGKERREAAYPDGPSWGDIKVSNVKLNGKAATAAVGGEDEDILTVAFDKPLYPTARYKVSMDFKLKLANIMHRLGYNANTVNLGNWYPIACVYENGGFCAEPYYTNGDPFYSDIANYEVTMTVPSPFLIASTGEIQKSSENGGKTTYTMKARAVRDFAMALGDKFQTVAGKAGKTTVTYYYYGDKTPDASLKAAVDSLTAFNALFGVYPYKTLAVARTGFIHGGMEYPNLVYVSDAESMSYEYYQEVIIHEVAHQWWYGVVGNNQIKDAWMDEGFADYSATLFYEKHPGYNQTRGDRIMQTMKEYLVFTDIIKTYMQKDKTLDTSMNRPLDQYNTESEYVYMTYGKGQLLFDNLRNTIGDKAFFEGLQTYYSRNMFKNAKQENMIGAFEAASGKDLEGYFNAWIKGTVLITDLY